MNILLITYDLVNPGKNYGAVIKAINSSAISGIKIATSTYLLKTSLNTTSLRDLISRSMDVNDKLYITAVTNAAAWRGLDENISKWILDNQGSL